ncbi:galactose-binding domain-like protein [Aspergillus ambiguus]|uniref:anaphase promoting complex subunit DOC1 n=1 Tax=Aspergillus ambiguus TaxID=176160 RepID=UPI003CCCE789
MPRHHIRRQHPPVADLNTPDDPPAQTYRSRLDHAPPRQPQFHTPPTRGIPQLHPSSGPIDPVGERAVHPAAAAQAAIFSLFGRGVAGRPRGSVMEGARGYDDVEDEDEDEDDAAHDDGQFDDHEDDHSDFGPELNAGDAHDVSEDGMDEMVGNELEEIEDEDDEMMHDRERSPSPLPSNLREISSLASWTVSTHKPGCGVAALRNPSPTQYWQSDGPQPHTLTLHFFKLVAIVKIRVYLDFDMDESYTPTKMTFLAGMGGNDLVEFATWEGDAPCGWVDVPLHGVGGRNGGWVRKQHRHKRRKARKPARRGVDNDEDDDIDDVEDDDDDDDESEDEDDPYAGNVLKAMVLQMRVIENHQNGKDTHVRGFQVFARDDDRRRAGNAPSASADGRVRRHSARKSLRSGFHDDALDGRDGADGGKMTGLEEPDWMGEPVIR